MDIGAVTPAMTKVLPAIYLKTFHASRVSSVEKINYRSFCHNTTTESPSHLYFRKKKSRAPGPGLGCYSCDTPSTKDAPIKGSSQPSKEDRPTGGMKPWTRPHRGPLPLALPDPRPLTSTTPDLSPTPSSCLPQKKK